MTAKIRVLVVDDEPRARARLTRLLEPHADVTVVGEARSGEEAVQQVLALRPDVVFLDIQMPGLTGTEAAERLRAYLPESVRPALVFTTAYAEHAVKAFALESTDYLLKPVERDRLAEALRRVRGAKWSATGAAAPIPSAAPAAVPADRAFLTGHHGTALASIPVGALRSIEVEDGVAWAYTDDGSRTRLSGGLAQIEAELPGPFVRVSRSAVVNTERALRVRPVGSSFEVELEGGARVKVSRRRIKQLEAALGIER